MRILILDDDMDLLSALKDLLLRYRHDVDCSNNAPEALDLTTKTSYDFILVDYKMPDFDGLWFMSRVRLTNKTKVILMTAFVNREVINRMFGLGAAGYLIKPFDDQELIQHLAFHFGPPEGCTETTS